MAKRKHERQERKLNLAYTWDLRNARDQYLAAAGITPKNYRTTDPLLSQVSARTRRRRRIAKTLATVWAES